MNESLLTPAERKAASVEAVLKLAKLLGTAMSEMERDDFYDELWHGMRRELPKHWNNDE